MNKLRVLLLLAVMISACSKIDSPALENDKKYPVRFSIKGIKKAALSPSSKVQSVNTNNPYEIVPFVDLFIYNNQGELVAEKNTGCCNLTGELILEDLQEGNYTAIAAGYWSLEKFNMFNLSSAVISQNITDIVSGEVFLEKVHFEVNEGENDVNILLKRQVGLLKINIVDMPSPESIYVRATLYNTANTFRFKEFMPIHNDFDHKYQVSVQSLDQLGGYFMVADNNQSYKTNILLEVLDGSSEVLESKLVENVTVGTNIKTTLTGKLFNADPKGFSITVDADWEDEHVIEF